MKKFVPFISFLILLTSCIQQESVDIPKHIEEIENLTVYSSDISLPSQIQFERIHAYGGDADQPIGRLSDIAVDSSGLIYIADSQELNIKIYESDGQFLTAMGRRGQGPGEFQEISGIQINGERLYVFDRNQQKVVVFSTDPHEYDYSVSIADNRDDYLVITGAHLNNIFVRSNHSFLMEFSIANMPENISSWDKYGGQRFYYLLDRDGEITSEQLLQAPSIYQVLIPFGGRSTGMPFEFYGKPLTILSNDDHIFHAWSEEFLIKVYTPEGEYKHAFYYPFDRTPLEPKSVLTDAGDDFIQAAVQSMEFPDNWPAINDMLIDDQNRLWVSTIVEDLDIYYWWILEETGELITQFEWPRDEPIRIIKNGFMYSSENHKETGLQQIIRYRIIMEEI
jgi:hypothetical protein